MRSVLRVILIVWFVAVSVLVLWPSTLAVLFPPPPTAVILPPVPPAAPTKAVNPEAAASFARASENYKLQVDAYLKYIEAIKATSSTPSYESVVRFTLTPILDRFLVAFLGWSFVVTAGGVTTNILRSRLGKEPEQLEHW